MVTYDLMKQQIEREVSSYWEDIKNKAGITRPEMEYKKGEISIKFSIKDFPKVDVLNVIDVLKGYYKQFANLNTDVYSGYRLTAKLKEDYWFMEKINEDQKKRNEIEISFDLDRISSCLEDRVNNLIFAKKTELSQEEINCVIDVWKKYAERCREESVSSNIEDIEKELFDLGAEVYRKNKGFNWECIAGYDKIKREINETVILPFKHPDVYKKVGELTRERFNSNVPHAVLFEGPPGTGKTTMARIISNESNIPMVYVPIESIMSCWYGVAEKRLAKVFDCSNKLNGCMLFLDEIDALASSRDNDMHEATRRVLSVLLRKMQGFVSSEKVLTIGATNRAKDLDHALISRFDRRIQFPLPDASERQKIFRYYAKHLDEESTKRLAESTGDKSGRNIEDICEDAERKWASRLISENKEICPPSLEIYLKSIEHSG